MLAIEDCQLPILARMDESLLNAITGFPQTELLRFRYRQHRRAVLHVASIDCSGKRLQQGVIWCFAGDKAKRLSRAHAGARFHAATQTAFEVFPDDHRLPEIRSFLNDHVALLRAITGERPVSPPEILRYRPGISATFRCRFTKHAPVFAKVIAKDDVNAIRQTNLALNRQLAHSEVRVARCIACDVSHRLVVYECAEGLGLDELLSSHHTKDREQLLTRSLDGLQSLSALRHIDARCLDSERLLARATMATRIISARDAVAGKLAHHMLKQMQAQTVAERMSLIHGDMKPEHLFLDDSSLTLIDTESLSIGDPDYDLAKLESRLVAAQLMDMITEDMQCRYIGLIRDRGASAYRWYLSAAVLQTAKFFAQRPGADNTVKCQRMLQWIS